MPDTSSPYYGLPVHFCALPCPTPWLRRAVPLEWATRGFFDPELAVCCAGRDEAAWACAHYSDSMIPSAHACWGLERDDGAGIAGGEACCLNRPTITAAVGQLAMSLWDVTIRVSLTIDKSVQIKHSRSPVQHLAMLYIADELTLTRSAWIGPRSDPEQATSGDELYRWVT